MHSGFQKLRRYSTAAFQKRAASIWRSDKVLDRVVKWESSVNVVRKVMNVLSSKEGPVMSMYDFARSKTMKHKNKLLIRQILVRFPNIFKFHQDKEAEFWVEFTPEAEQIIEQERLAIRRHDELVSVDILKKLLMMSRDHRIGLEKLGHLKHEFLFPDGFKERLLPRFPEFFKIVKPGKGLGYVELVGWDSSLAVTARELKLKMKPSSSNPFAFPVAESVRLNTEARRFQELGFVSPYEDGGAVEYNTLENEKRIVGVLHELLSLMPMKRSVHGRLVLLREELNLPRAFVSIAEIYNWIFYVSPVIPKNKTVFVRDAFDGGRLREPSYLYESKEKLLELMRVTYETSPGKPPKPKLQIDREDLEDIDDFFVSYAGPLRDL